jgi:NAD(P)-dependent dehydrogenase (short-subunit alcohol dehydrogenase family)
MNSLDPSSLFSVEGKVALITGGSRGIGRMMAQGLLQAGAQRVYITARKLEPCQQTAKELSEFGDCVALGSDVSTQQGRTDLLNAIGKNEAALHILINNAGAAWGAPFDEYPDSAFDKLMNVNVSAVFALTRDFAPLLRAAATGADPARVINVGSMDGEHVPSASHTGTYAYVSSKAAVHHLTRALAVDLGPQHITVNTVAPGFYPSKMTAHVMEEHMDHLEGNCPLGRVGRPEEMAGIAVYLCSRAGAFTNGATLVIDGGTSVSHQHLRT